MTALYTIITPSDGVQGGAFAAIADDSGAHYLFPDGSSGVAGLDDDRIITVASYADTTPTDALTWLNLACTNLLYVDMTDPAEAADLEAATRAAGEALAALPAPVTAAAPEPSPVEPDPWTPPATRDELMAWQRQMMDDWAEQYPEAAAGDVDDPEADLALAQLLTPPVNPELPHKWLPLALDETECGFCDKPAEDPIHTTSADTITSGPK